MPASIPKVKMFLADSLVPAVVPDGTSLEEKMNTFLATLDPVKVLEVYCSLSKSGKYGENFMFAGNVLYKT